MAEIKVVTAALIEFKGLYLISRREEGKFKGLYEFPGGKLKPREKSLEYCLRREIKEELGIRIKDLTLFDVSSLPEKEERLVLIGYLCRPCSTNIKEGVKYAWVTVEQMTDYEFCPADIKFVKKLQQKEVPRAK